MCDFAVYAAYEEARLDSRGALPLRCRFALPLFPPPLGFPVFDSCALASLLRASNDATDQ